MIAIEPLVERAALAFRVEPSALISPRRSRDLSFARWALMWALRQHDWTLVAIGQALGGRDHTTVLHGIRQAEARACADEQYALQLAALR